MKRALLAASAVLVATGAGIGLSQVANSAAPAAVAAIPAKVDNFQLTDQSLMAHELYYFKYAPAIVVMSRQNGSAYSKAAAAELEKLAAAYKQKGVLFYMLDSNTADSRDAIAAEHKAQSLTIPILVDEQQLVGEQLGVAKEGEVYVIDPKTWTIAYHGALDARFSSASPKLSAQPGKAYAAQAIDAVLAGQSAPTLTAAVGGKAIAFPARAHKAEFAKISYAKDVAPVIEEKCVACHISGGIAPFAMDGYEKVKGFAPMIRETIRTSRMPPYFADPHIGHFKNDQGLTADQKKMLVHWVEAGAPRGDGPDPLAANKTRTAPEWPVNLGKPDVIVELPAFNVPASGIVEYQNQLVDNPFKQDTWLRAIAMKPGDRRVLHHVVSQYVADPKGPRPEIPGGSVGSYTPGAEPQIMADNAGAPVPGGGKLTFQMHYTTFGKAVTDKTEVGFYTLKAPPKFIKRSTVIGNFGLYIPAGEARHKETAYVTMPADAYLYTLYPHAHYRGYHVELKEITPDGKEQMLLALPKYDFNWQRDYDPVEPILVKAGTKLVATWVYDNSVHNKSNPDPKRNVTWGEQTPDEMMYFRINYRWADETVGHLRNDLEAKLQGSTLLGGLDANMDGKVTPDELKGPLGMLKTAMPQLDKNKDGALDESELGAVMAMMMRQMADKGPTSGL
jgi:peroxiredoxin